MTKTQEEDYSEFARHFVLGEPLRGKTVAITGATGLLGTCMVHCLDALNQAHSLDITIIAIVRNEEKARRMLGAPHAHLIYKVHDFAADEPLTLPVRADFLVHFASPTASQYFVSHPVETMQTGLNGTTQVLELAKTMGIASLVYVSSLEVYGTVLDDSTPLTEDRQGYLDPMAVRSGYPMVKRASECLCHAYASEYDTPVKVARLAQTFGAGVAKDDQRVFAQFARSVINRQDIVLHTTGELSRCYCYTTDAIDALLHIMLKGADGEAYNVANASTYISIRDMANLVCSQLGHGIQTCIELKDGMGYSPVTKLRLDTAKVEALGWQPHHDLTTMFHRLITDLSE